MASSAGQSINVLPQSYTSIPAGPAHLSAPPSSTDPNTYTPPPYTTFPPFYTLQPNLTTRARQLELWTAHILAYCAHPTHRLYRLNLSTPPADLFANSSLSRSLKPSDVRLVLEHMASPSGGASIEWLPPASRGEVANAVYVWWKSASEWADALYGWVEGTGQKGAVLTVYELREGGDDGRREWAGMEEGMLRKVLGVLVKRGRAQVFGEAGGEGEGVKFF